MRHCLVVPARLLTFLSIKHMKLRWIVIAGSLLTIGGCTSLANTSQTTASQRSLCRTINCQLTSKLYKQWSEPRSPNVAQLNLFFNRMPKGGDIHHHFSGSIYAETYLDWMKQQGYLINPQTFKGVSPKEAKHVAAISVDALRQNNQLYRELLSRWSNKDYHSHYHLQSAPDKAFFDTFGYFGSTAAKHWHAGLQILKQRAIQENVSYLEVMLTSMTYPLHRVSDQRLYTQVNQQLTQINHQSQLTSAQRYLKEMQLYQVLYRHLTQDQAFQTQIKQTIRQVNEAAQGIDDSQFMMRYQTYASRNSQPSQVFSSLYAAFSAAAQDPLIVGVNIVGPENGVVALADYSLHMNMFKFLRAKYPHVHVAMHAGELTLAMVRPKNLKFHISQAIHIAGTDRIGHGVDISYESAALNDLNIMKTKPVPVEICLTSNEFILGVKGQAHPYLIYSQYGVPLVIATDDSGVSRDNLSDEYRLLATRYHPSYAQIKTYVYNSIRYSFLTQREKRRRFSDLDQRFNRFEAKMAAYSQQLRSFSRY